MNESCHANDWVTSCTCMSYVTHVNESRHMHYESRHTPHCLSPCPRNLFEWVMTHTWVSHVTHKNEPCLRYEWVMSHVWLRHVCCTYAWVMSHIWIRHVRHHIYLQHIELIYICNILNFILRMNETPDTYKWVIYSCILVIYFTIYYVWIRHVRHHIYSKYIQLYITYEWEILDTYKWVMCSCIFVIYFTIYYVWIRHVRHHIHSKYI